MLPSDLDSLTPTQRLIVEQAYVMAQELEAAGDSAPDGQVIDRCESFLLVNGRDFLRRVLARISHRILASGAFLDVYIFG